MSVEFTSRIPEFNEELQKLVDTSLNEAGMIIEAAAKENVFSKGTGQLRDSISHHLNGNGNETSVEIGSPLNYAVYNEFGTGEFAENGAGRKGGWVYQGADGKYYHTKGLKPKKFLRTAFRDNKATVINKITEDFRRLS